MFDVCEMDLKTQAFLSRIPALQHLIRSSRTDLAEALRRVDLPVGVSLPTSGRGFTLVESGEIVVDGAHYREGMVFGDTKGPNDESTGNEPTGSLTVVSGPCTLLVLSHESFEALNEEVKQSVQPLLRDYDAVQAREIFLAGVPLLKMLSRWDTWSLAEALTDSIHQGEGTLIANPNPNPNPNSIHQGEGTLIAQEVQDDFKDLSCDP